MNNLIDSVKEKILIKSENIYLWLIYELLMFIYIIPVFLINVRYQDDLGSSLTGTYGIYGDGRPLGAKIMNILSCGGLNADISPFPLIIAISLFTYLVVLYFQNRISFMNKDLAVVLVLLYVATNPFIVSNLYYRADCVPMVFSIALPFGMYAISSKYKCLDFILAFITSICVMSLYQAGIGLMLILTIIDVIMVILSDKKGIRSAIIKSLGILSGIMMYMLIIAPRYVEKSGWRQDASHTSFMMENVVKNFFKCFDFMKQYYNNMSKLSIVSGQLLIVFTVITIIYISYKREEKIYLKIINGILTILGLIMSLICSFLPLCFLESLGVKSRIYISLCGVMLYIGIVILMANKSLKHIAIILLLACLLGRYSYMFALGNAINSEGEYEKYLAYNIARDIETLNYEGEYSNYCFIGDSPQSINYKLMLKKYPNFGELVPNYFYNDPWIGAAWVEQYLQSDISVVDEITEKDKTIIDEQEPVVNNSSYECYTNDGTIIISFKNNR